MYLTRDIGKMASTAEESIAKKDNWVRARWESGRRISKELPLQAELNWRDASQPPIPCILPENAISRNGYVNEIWVPSYTRTIPFYDRCYVGVIQELPIGCGVTLVYVWKGSDREILLLSPAKLKIIPFLSESQLNRLGLNKRR